MSNPILPYDDGDRLSEAEFAQRIGTTTRSLREWRAKRTGPPYTRSGRRIEYSWIKYLRHLADTEQQPVRVRKSA